MISFGLEPTKQESKKSNRRPAVQWYFSYKESIRGIKGNWQSIYQYSHWNPLATSLLLHDEVWKIKGELSN